MTNREKNLSYLEPIIETIILIRSTDLMLRYPLDYSDYCDRMEDGIEQEDDLNDLFLNMLQIREDGGCDEKVSQILNHDEKRKKYTCKEMQNQIIKVCKDVITGRLVKKIKESNVFSITFDRVYDVEENDYVALAIRYLDRNDELHEDFLRYIPYDDTLEEEGVKKLILETLADIGLDMADCRAQCYFNGETNLQHQNMPHLINNEYPSASFYYYVGQNLITTISKTSVVKKVSYPLKSLERIVELFIEFPERMKCFKKHIKKNNSGDTARKLRKISKNNWLEHNDSVKVFEALLSSIDSCLHELMEEGYCFNRHITFDAHFYYNSSVSFEFIVIIVICRSILDYLAPLSKLLQTCEEDILAGYGMISDVKIKLQQVKTDIDSYHDTWYAKGVALANSVDKEECKPKINILERQQPTFTEIDENDSPNEYFKKKISIPYLCDVTSKLEERFPVSATTCVDAFKIIPSIMLSSTCTNWKESALKFMKTYANDMPYLHLIETELQNWYQYWLEKRENADLPSTLISTLKSMASIKVSFPNIYSAFKVLAVIPITNKCENYKSFHKHSLMKCCIPALVTPDRLNCAELFYMAGRKGIEISVEEVLEEFKKDPVRLLDF